MRRLIGLVLLSVSLCASVASAQGRFEQGRSEQSRSEHSRSEQGRSDWRPGWEAAIGLTYQDSNDIEFLGGSRLKTDGEIGVVGQVGYRLNPKLDLLFGFDSATVDYSLTRQSATTPGVTDTLETSYEIFTPYFRANYNFLDRPLTPFVSAGFGWSFIDTNIPTGRVFVGCWWDPWYGYVCTAQDETKTTDAATYQLGIGAKWSFGDYYGLRVEYQKQWINLSRARGTPDFDQIRATFVVKY